MTVADAGGVDGEPSDGALLIRVWSETGDPARVRARVFVFDGLEEPRSFSTRAGETAVLDAVRTWLRSRSDAVPKEIT